MSSGCSTHTCACTSDLCNTFSPIHIKSLSLFAWFHALCRLCKSISFFPMYFGFCKHLTIKLPSSWQVTWENYRQAWWTHKCAFIFIFTFQRFNYTHTHTLTLLCARLFFHFFPFRPCHKQRTIISPVNHRCAILNHLPHRSSALHSQTGAWPHPRFHSELEVELVKPYSLPVLWNVTLC